MPLVKFSYNVSKRERRAIGERSIYRPIQLDGRYCPELLLFSAVDMNPAICRRPLQRDIVTDRRMNPRVTNDISTRSPINTS